MKKEFERQKKKYQEISEILLNEIKHTKTKIEKQLNSFLETISQRQGSYDSEVFRRQLIIVDSFRYQYSGIELFQFLKILLTKSF